jgi:hypothetical protein
MSIKRTAQVLSTMVQMQDLDTLAVILGYCPRLKGFVRLERLVFGAQEKGESIAGHVIREGDEVLAALPGTSQKVQKVCMVLGRPSKGYLTNKAWPIWGFLIEHWSTYIRAASTVIFTPI